jgi:putative SOS response-associated peptidase YedK
MCYSAMLTADLKRIAQEFSSRVDYAAFRELYAQRLENPELKIPLGLDRYFAFSAEPQERAIGELAKRFHQEERARSEASLAEEEESWANLPGRNDARREKTHENTLRKLRKKLEVSLERISPLDERIFPGYFAPVIVAKGKDRFVVPMRYRVRLPDGKEIPSKYNVFNARRDSLLSAPTWRPLFGHQHAIFPFTKFFEWVEREEKKREIVFSPQDRSLMWAACLYSAPKAGLTRFPTVLSLWLPTSLLPKWRRQGTIAARSSSTRQRLKPGSTPKFCPSHY